MRELWNAFVARLVYWLTPKPYVPPPAPIIQAPDPPLTTGICVCSHSRCTHEKGKDRCHGQYKPNTEVNDTNDWLHCGCQVYIPDDDDDFEDEPETPTPSELERLWQK